jgi:hypothetical protein
MKGSDPEAYLRDGFARIADSSDQQDRRIAATSWRPTAPAEERWGACRFVAKSKVAILENETWREYYT